MNINIKQLSREDIIEGFGNAFGSKQNIDCKEISLHLDGDRRIVSYKYPFGISYIMISGNFDEDLKISIEDNKRETLLMLYCMDGEVSHVLSDGRLQYRLGIMHGSISSSPSNRQQCIDLKGKEDIKLCMILIRKNMFYEKIKCEMEKMPDHLERVFEKGAEREEPFLYNGHYSYAISSLLEEIQENKHEGVVKSIFIEAKLLELFSYQIKQYKDDQKNPSDKLMMRESDLELILKAKQYIQKNFKSPPTIKDLSKEIGINQTKLKKGFKMVFESTVGEFIRSERLMQASILLVRNNYSIREISSIVGYENQSHFSRQFKKKFGMLPKDYRQMHFNGNMEGGQSSWKAM